jgi:hypothetical protein
MIGLTITFGDRSGARIGRGTQQKEAKMSKEAILTIYEPTKESFPYITVVLFPNGTVQGLQASNREEAEKLKSQIVSQVNVDTVENG